MAGLQPREGKFFDDFNDHAQLAMQAVNELAARLAHLPCAAFISALAWWGARHAF